MAVLAKIRLLLNSWETVSNNSGMSGKTHEISFYIVWKARLLAPAKILFKSYKMYDS